MREAKASICKSGWADDTIFPIVPEAHSQRDAKTGDASNVVSDGSISTPDKQSTALSSDVQNQTTTNVATAAGRQLRLWELHQPCQLDSPQSQGTPLTAAVDGVACAVRTEIPADTPSNRRAEEVHSEPGESALLCPSIAPMQRLTRLRRGESGTSLRISDGDVQPLDVTAHGESQLVLEGEDEQEIDSQILDSNCDEEEVQQSDDDESSELDAEEAKQLHKRKQDMQKRIRRETHNKARALRNEVEDYKELSNASERVVRLGTSTMTEGERQRWESIVGHSQATAAVSVFPCDSGSKISATSLSTNKSMGSSDVKTGHSTASKRKLYGSVREEDDSHLYHVVKQPRTGNSFLGARRLPTLSA